MHQIWLIVDDKGKIQHCWEAPDPPKKGEDLVPPLALDPMPSGWKVIKVKAPGLLKEFEEEARKAGKTLSKFILDECEIDKGAQPERPPGLPQEILFSEIRRKP